MSTELFVHPPETAVYDRLLTGIVPIRPSAIENECRGNGETISRGSIEREVVVEPQIATEKMESIRGVHRNIKGSREYIRKPLRAQYDYAAERCGAKLSLAAGFD